MWIPVFNSLSVANWHEWEPASFVATEFYTHSNYGKHGQKWASPNDSSNLHYVLLAVSYFIPSEMLFAQVSPELQPQERQAPSTAPQEAERSCDKPVNHIKLNQEEIE